MHSQKTKKTTIVIDAGHGGSDSGAIGLHRLKEKQLTLNLAQKLSVALQQKGINVLLTRKSDRGLSLAQRAEKAHKNQADFYISIHANASENKEAEGFEVWSQAENQYEFNRNQYFLSKEKEVLHGFTLLERHEHKNRLLSLRLAQSIQKKVIKNVSKKYQLKDRQNRRGSKKTHQYLFIPSIIIEAGFITHKKEGQLLQVKEYQDQLIAGITDGVVSFLAS